jgi:hypothetical protein
LFEIGNGASDQNRSNILTILNNNHIGLGTIYPTALLHVADSSVVFTANGDVAATPNDPPVTTVGRRMMWYADKAAFRVGYVSNTNWNKANMGNYSFAAGYDTRAAGLGSIAIGVSSIATGTGALAMGYINNATGNFTTALGYSSTASTNFATSLGYSTQANGVASTATGDNTIAKAVGSFVAGRFNEATDAPNINTPQSTDRIFQLGNGADIFNRSNALTILRSGVVGIGITNPTRALSFAPSLEKKISFYPGATGDVGISVAGNDLRIFSDNSAARISFGYDDYVGGFTARAYVPASGAVAMVVNGQINANGTIYNSDARFKKDIHAITAPLDKITSLNGVLYHYRTNEFPEQGFDNTEQMGLIAQEVERVLPQLVFTNEKGYKSVDYAKIVPLLIEGMKSQQQQIDELKKLVQTLTQR